MREQVELLVNALGGDAVEYKLRAPARASSFWQTVVYVLWIIAGACVASSHSTERGDWQLCVGGAAAIIGVAIHVLIGSVIVEESALVVPSMGVQLTQRKRNGGVAKQFIAASDISAVVINEGFVFSDVVYYIAFMVRGRENMVVAFEHFRPRITLLAEVFRQIKSALFPGDAATMHLPDTLQ